MVTEWGMSDKLGPIAYSSDGPVFIGRDFEERATYSEATAAIIDSEVKAIVSAAYARAKKLLSENRSVLDNMARVLVEAETIYTAEVDMLMKGAGYKEVLEYMETHDKGKPDNPFGITGQDAAKANETPASEEPAAAETAEEPSKDEPKPTESAEEKIVKRSKQTKNTEDKPDEE